MRPPSITTYALDILALTILSHALVNLLLIDETITPNIQQQGNTLLQSLNILVYAFYGLRLLLDASVIRRLRSLAQTDRAFWLPLAALLAIACVSALWSGEPLVAFRRALAISGTCMVGAYLALRYTPRQFLVLVLGLSAVFVVSSIAMVVLWPEKGMMQLSTIFEDVHQGRWRGIFLHKNHLGSLMAVGAVAAAGMLHGRGRQLLATALILLLCVGLLLAAESLTALLAAAAGLLVVATLRLVSRKENDSRDALLSFAPVLLLAVCAALYQYAHNKPDAPRSEPLNAAHTLVTNERATILDANGIDSARAKPQREGFRRDAGATGRIDMWRLCWQAIQMQPWHGYGYGTFWRSGGPSELVWQKADFRMPHAHNGWIDLALQLGVPATLLMALWILWLGMRLLRWVHTAADAATRTAAITLSGLWCCLNVINLAETALFREHELLTALLIAIAVLTSQGRSPEAHSPPTSGLPARQPATPATSAR